MQVWATAGKGTAGKSTLLVAMLQDVCQLAPDIRILVVDADPHSIGSRMLGCPSDMPTIGKLRTTYEDELTGRTQQENKVAAAERLMGKQAIVAQQGFDILSMGTWTLQGSQCTVNRTLERGLLAVMRNYDLVIIDNEAGIEQIGRYTHIPIDQLLLVTRPKPVYLQVTRMIIDHCFRLQRRVGHMHLVINDATESYSDVTKQWIANCEVDAPVIAMLPSSEALQNLADDDVPASHLPADDDWRQAVSQMTKQLLSLSFGDRTL